MNTNDIIYMTEDGIQKLEAELLELRTSRLNDIEEKLATAISEGELSENPAYESALKEQAIAEGRISAIEDALRTAVVVEDDGDKSGVRVGSTVQISEEGWDDEVEEYRIVGALMAAPSSGLISNESPIGSALLGARVGDTVAAETPGGELRYRIISIG